MNTFNIHLTGVGGQGIGLLSEVLLRAADHAGLPARGVDTHGLAQRGGMVVSHLRLGAGAHSPIVKRGDADLVVALERHEALRGATQFLKQGGTLAFYDACWQPLEVRLGKAPEVTAEQIAAEVARRAGRSLRVEVADLVDVRMQNVALLGTLAKEQVLPGVTLADYRQALTDLLPPAAQEKNLQLFARMAG